MGGKSRLGAAEMPFAPRTGRITSRGQQLRDGYLPQRQAVRTAAKRNLVRASADGKTARHERGSAGGALRLDVEVEQPHALAREAVDTRRGRTAKDATAVSAELAITQVVHEHEDNVWLLLLCSDRSDGANHRSHGQ